MHRMIAVPSGPSVELASLVAQPTRSPVSLPNYDRAELVPSIVHIGVGGFHRAHQAVYLDDLAVQGISLDWGIVGAGLHGRKMKDALEPQDNLFTVVERGADHEHARVVASMTDYLYAPEECRRLRDRLADSRVRIVSLTITGGGYHLDPKTGDLDDGCAEVVGDLEKSSHFTTAIAYLVDALDERRRAGIAPFTVLSCDNIPDNGAAARVAVVCFAGLRDPALAVWIDRNVSFPSTMVDRITPKAAPTDRSMVENRFGIVDRWPVLTEPFSQWVIEDQFCNGRPPLDEVGVEFVTDVAPHKLAKTRLLNGSHCALGVIGGLLGHQTTAQAMNDRLVRGYIEQLLRLEIATVVPAVDGLDLDEYCDSLMERLANPKIGDRLSRLRGRGSTKFPSYLLPSLHDARSRGLPTSLLVVAVAGWIRALLGTDLQGDDMEMPDARADELRARVSGSDPRPLLAMTDIFGSLGDDPSFVAELEDTLRAIDRVGLHAVLRRSAHPIERGASA